MPVRAQGPVKQIAGVHEAIGAQLRWLYEVKPGPLPDPIARLLEQLEERQEGERPPLAGDSNSPA